MTPQRLRSTPPWRDPQALVPRQGHLEHTAVSLRSAPRRSGETVFLAGPGRKASAAVGGEELVAALGVEIPTLERGRRNTDRNRDVRSLGCCGSSLESTQQLAGLRSLWRLRERADCLTNGLSRALHNRTPRTQRISWPEALGRGFTLGWSLALRVRGKSIDEPLLLLAQELRGRSGVV